MNNKLTLAALAVLLTLGACKKTDNGATEEPPLVVPEVIGDNHPLLLGNPTEARRSAQFSENYLMAEPTYRLAYSATRGIPVWVAWHLQSEYSGNVNRQDDFRQNPLIPASWVAIRPNDYSTSNFDRGHNVPSEDRTASVADNSSTFLMTNIIPQAPQFNQGPWASMESQIRTLVGTGNEAYIFMGNYGTGGVGTNNVVTERLNGVVTVPQMVYKIVVLMPKGNNDLTRLDTSAQILAVDMPNDNRLYTGGGAASAWRNYIVPIDSIEARLNRAGRPHLFLAPLPENVRTYLKKKTFRG